MSTGAGDPVYSVVWPRSPRTAGLAPTAPRLDALEGKTIAFAWDYLFRGDEIWELLKEGLTARYPGMRFIGFEEFGSTHGPDEREIVAGLGAKLKAMGVDALVSGMGC
jgi:hypothetical protein